MFTQYEIKLQSEKKNAKGQPDLICNANGIRSETDGQHKNGQCKAIQVIKMKNAFNEEQKEEQTES